MTQELHYHKFMLQNSFYIELAAALPCATRAPTPPDPTPLHAPLHLLPSPLAIPYPQPVHV